MLACRHDSDCTDGVNGRCQDTRFGCLTSCSYDTCQSDADCPERAACECRSDASSLGNNRCITNGDCRVDADCGPGGFCSPSLLGERCSCTSVDYCAFLGDDTCADGRCSCGDSCGHAYYCHTLSDTCVDDADCPDGAACAFDLAHQAWECNACWPIP